MKRYCPHCHQLVDKGHSCTRTEQRRREREPWRASYARSAYQRARQEAIARTHGMCAACGKVVAHHDGMHWTIAGNEGEVHHVCPLRAGGSDEAGNLVLLCAKCHRRADAELRARTQKPRSWG